MSKKNYYRPNQEVKTEPASEAIEEVKEEIPAKETVEETTEEEVVEEPAVPETILGKVVNCKLLNVRPKPTKDSTPLCVIKAGDVVEIKKSESSDEWYKVITVTGVEGYCMSKYILE